MKSFDRIYGIGTCIYLQPFAFFLNDCERNFKKYTFNSNDNGEHNSILEITVKTDEW